MQLFITSFDRAGNEIVISNPDVVHQAMNVLRYTVGTKVWIQESKSQSIRYEVELIELQKKHLRGRVVQEIKAPIGSRSIHMLIALPNKFAKLELIAQKLAEIGVSQITVRPGQRSQLRELPSSKLERLDVIMREAVEQSRGRMVPQISFSKTLPEFLGEETLIVFDAPGEEQYFGKTGTIASVVGVVGPEGGFSPEERVLFQEKKMVSVSLGESVLRMETAAIIGSWYLKHIL